MLSYWIFEIKTWESHASPVPSWRKRNENKKTKNVFFLKGRRRNASVTQHFHALLITQKREREKPNETNANPAQARGRSKHGK
jgi:hypothetical protein